MMGDMRETNTENSTQPRTFTQARHVTPGARIVDPDYRGREVVVQTVTAVANSYGHPKIELVTTHGPHAWPSTYYLTPSTLVEVVL